MTEQALPVFRSDLYVELLTQAGGDDSIVQSALVSSRKNPADYDDAKKKGLIESLMRQRHGTPFESGYFEFYIEAPRAVRDEHVRHRVQSYSSTSLRYRMGAPEYYIPPFDRPLKPAEDHKAMKPHYEPLDSIPYQVYTEMAHAAYESSFAWLNNIKQAGFEATEALRWFTNDGLYTPYIARCNPRSLMHFLSLRVHDPYAAHVSFPMWEIEKVASRMEDIFREKYPVTHEAFVKFGREAP